MLLRCLLLQFVDLTFVIVYGKLKQLWFSIQLVIEILLRPFLPAAYGGTLAVLFW